MKTLSMFILVSAASTLAQAQGVGVASNVLFPGGNNLSPVDQEILISPDGSYIAVLGTGGDGDVVITEIDRDGTVLASFNLAFPAGNEISAVNRGLTISHRGSFLCAYGSDVNAGDLVFIARDAAGTWFTTNVAFPAINNVPLVGTLPVISRDESFIACRGNSAADLVLVPVDDSAGFPQPGVPFNVALAGGNDIPSASIDPVIAPNGRSLAVPGTLQNGDLAILTIGRPVTPANTTVANISFPAGNSIRNNLVPVAVSPQSNYYCVHGQSTLGDLVVVPVTIFGVPEPAINVLWPSNANTASDLIPPAISGDGRLVAVNGTLIAGDIVLLPIAPGGTPGTPLNVAFPGNGFVANAQLAPVISNDARLVVQRGSPTIGDLVVLQVTFTTPVTLAFSSQNVLYPANNNVPNAAAGIVLAPDRSFCATLGSQTVGDLVITAFDVAGMPQTPQNVLYPNNNNTPNSAITPALSKDGLLLLTPGNATVGDAVITRVGLDSTTGLIRATSVTNVLYPANNNNAPASREPRFSPTSQFLVSSGSAAIGDLVVVQLLQIAPHLLAPGDMGTVVPVRFISPADAGRQFAAAAAFGRWPGLVLSDGRRIPLDLDPLFIFSRSAAAPFFTGFDGFLDARGLAEGAVFIPQSQGGEGFWFYLAFATADPASPTGIGTISEPAPFVLQ